MTAFTLDLPDDLAARLAALPKAEVNAYAASVLTPLVGDGDEENDDEDENGEPDPELIAALREALADEEAGNLRTLEQVDAAVEAALSAGFGPVGKAA